MKRALLVGAIVVALLLSVVAYSFAATSGNVAVTASSKVVLSLTVTPSVPFGALDPGTASAVIPVTITVDSNKAYTVTKDVTTDGANIALMGLTTSLPATWVNAGKAVGITATDNYQATVPFTTDPGPLSATVGYSVVQN